MSVLVSHSSSSLYEQRGLLFRRASFVHHCSVLDRRQASQLSSFAFRFLSTGAA